MLIHQLPPRPLYLRAKIRQRLAKVGAIALKNSVYVLPSNDDRREDLEWIAQEARSGGGEAFVCAAAFVDGLDDRELVMRFDRDRKADYRATRGELTALLSRTNPGDEGALEPELARIARRLDEVKAIDFFEAAEGKEVAKMLSEVQRKLRRKAGGPATNAGRRPDLSGKVWVTRRGVKIDRIASAWLIRRFIDPAARFRFVDPAEDVKKPGQLRFDMAGGDYTHEGERCTFETFLVRAGLDDAALTPIAEIVHDIDLKDGKYNRPDAAGIKQLLEGLIATHESDEERLERGFALFDDLHASFRKQAPGPQRGRRKR